MKFTAVLSVQRIEEYLPTDAGSRLTKDVNSLELVGLYTCQNS